MSTRSELSSVATGLGEIAERISAIAEGLDGTEKDLVGPALFDVERSLRSAERRLAKLLRG